ncbi:MAG: hypothetical protein WD749_13485 [Phycisphaerales bacterium]
MRRHHTRCIAAATALLLLLVAAPPARAQNVEPPEPNAAMAAFHRVADFVRARPLAPGAERLVECPAIAVTLRLDGQVIGRGATISADPSAAGSAVPQAAVTAITEARQRVPIERDALFEEKFRALAERFTVTLELSGALIPLAPREWADVAAEVAPGLEGVAVRLGDRLAAFFPEQMLATGTDPAAAAGSLVSRLTGDPTLALKKPAELIAEHGAVFYRFKSTTIAQPRAGASPMFLHRGGRVVRQSEMTEAELRRWAAQMAATLQRWRSTGENRTGADGGLDPVLGQVLADWAPPADQVLVAYSLVSYFRAAETFDKPGAKEAGYRASLIMRDLAIVDPGEAEPWSDVVAAEFCQAMLVSMKPLMWVDDPGVSTLWERCIDATKGVFHHEKGFAPSVPRGRLGLVAWARLMVDYATTLDGPGQEYAAVTEAFKATPPGELVSQMPWLGWADVRYGHQRAAVALREMREMVWKHQLRPEDLPADQQDFAGGIMFTASRQPLPTWHAARPLAFIATMLGDERLTPDEEVPAELSRLLASLRFLRQLTAAEAEGHMYANPDQALGGVRASLFDQRMPPEATAFTLMTVCETLLSLEKIKQRQARAKAAEQP